MSKDKSYNAEDTLPRVTIHLTILGSSSCPHYEKIDNAPFASETNSRGWSILNGLIGPLSARHIHREDNGKLPPLHRKSQNDAPPRASIMGYSTFLQGKGSLFSARLKELELIRIAASPQSTGGASMGDSESRSNFSPRS